MAKILFWNVGKKDLTCNIRTLCDELKVDVLILAECPIKDADLLDGLNTARSGSPFSIPLSNSKLIKVLARYPPSNVKPVEDGTRWTIRELFPPAQQSIILVAAHLPSKLHRSSSEQLLHSTLISSSIHNAEKRLGHRRTIVIGDLNMNPFEDGMVAAEGLHAVMDARIASKGERKVDGIARPIFYNPMWNFLGDKSTGPAGTYFDRSGGSICYFWNTFDQILIRPDLLSKTSTESFKVISKCGADEFFSADGKWQCPSDHLPLLATIG